MARRKKFKAQRVPAGCEIVEGGDGVQYVTEPGLDEYNAYVESVRPDAQTPVGTLWTTPADPTGSVLAGLDTNGSAADVARQIRTDPRRNIEGRVAVFRIRPLAPETRMKSTGK